jgi:hypothetical protein
MHIGNMIVQWATAASRQAPLPILTLNSKADLAKLQQKVPELVTPSIIVPNISQALLFKPSQLALPLFVLPAELSSEVMVMLPEITSLPSFLVLSSDNKQVSRAWGGRGRRGGGGGEVRLLAINTDECRTQSVLTEFCCRLAVCSSTATPQSAHTPAWELGVGFQQHPD